jgi:hypothetical protein
MLEISPSEPKGSKTDDGSLLDALGERLFVCMIRYLLQDSENRKWSKSAIAGVHVWRSRSAAFSKLAGCMCMFL